MWVVGPSMGGLLLAQRPQPATAAKPGPSPTPRQTGTHAAKHAVQHVVVIGVDGLGAKAVRENPMPKLRALMRQGAYSLTARGVMPTVSSPNWASLIMGAGPEQHGITSNDWQPEAFDFPPVCRGMAPMFPTVFGTLRQQRPGAHIVVIHDWEGFGRLLEPAAATVQRHVLTSPQATKAAIAAWKQQPATLLFLHLDDVDHAGHRYQWSSPEYKEAVAMVDGLIGEMVEAVRTSPAGPHTALFVIADHGGLGTRHGGLSIDELEIPIVFAGPGIKANFSLPAPAYNVDVAPTIARLLGLRAPACWVGRPLQEALLATP